MEKLNLLLYDYTFQTVALGTAMLGALCGIFGSFATLRKQSLLGDGISHAALPGVVTAFLITSNKETYILLLGALTTGLLAIACIISITKISRIKFDTALAIVMAVFFGIGITLLTVSRKVSGANQAGLDRFIYGQASTILRKDVYLILAFGIVLIFLLFIFWKELIVFSFDKQFAHSIGLKTNLLNTLLSFLIVLTIVLGLQTVGVILMSAMLVAPAVAARQWVNSTFEMVILAAIFGAVTSSAGTFISSIYSNLPTGPIIVLCACSLAIFSVLFAPKRGIIYRRRV